jgi:hypothetical protein
VSGPNQLFVFVCSPPVESTPEARSSVLQLAAREGKYSKSDCGDKFKCFFDILDLASYLIDWYKYSTTIDDNNL